MGKEGERGRRGCAIRPAAASVIAFSCLTLPGKWELLQSLYGISRKPVLGTVDKDGLLGDG